jgi:hypothetical protein
MPKSRKLIVFLCHAKEDKPMIREIHERLKGEAWISPWLDEANLLPGQDWEKAIREALRRADSIIVFLSKKSVKKESFIQKEIRIALEIAEEKLEGAIFIVPLRLDDCMVPNGLKKLQFLDYFVGEESYKRLLQSLEQRAKSIRLKTNIRTLQVELLLDLEPQYVEPCVFFVLPKLLSVKEESIVINRSEEGSKKIIVKLPERAARDLELHVQNERSPCPE